jgi:HTH-type transcriptional regulator/antitoxin HigA
MNVKPIKTEADYEAALETIAGLMDAKPGTPKGDRLDVLATLVDAYERKIHSIEPPDPIEAIKHTMDARDLTNKDLEAILHSRRERVWEIMHYKRPLSLTMIRRLNREIGIPAEVLIQSYDIENNARA